MSIPLLGQVYEEVRRLSIAGSAAAHGDFRLQKLVTPLKQAGQKAPVFDKVAQAITTLVESNEKSSPEALLELSTLINAILYTQGETGADGELQPIETTDLGAQHTQASARILKPLLEALTNTGSGRLEIIRDAHERGAFRDLRLVKPALDALDDAYGEIGDWIADKILPQYGKAILPELRAKFDLKGRGGHVRRLLLMHAFDPQGTREVVKQALEEGSKEIKVAAIECLGDSPEDMQFLLEQAQAKSKDVRAAALKALGKSANDAAATVLHAALQNDNLELAVAPIRSCMSSKLKKLVLEEAQKQFDALLATKTKDKVELGMQVQRMRLLLECLRDRKDEAVADFLVTAFAKRDSLAAIKSEPSGSDVIHLLTQIMATGPHSAQAALVDARDSLSDDNLAEAFLAACRSREPADVFAMFSPCFSEKSDAKKSKRSPDSTKRAAIVKAISSHTISQLDPRWLDLAVAQDDIDLALLLARPGHQGCNQLLRRSFDEKMKKSKEFFHAGRILRTMIQIQHPEATDATIEMINSQAKASYNYYWIAPLVTELPKEAAPKLEALLPGLPNKVADQLLDCLMELKNKP